MQAIVRQDAQRCCRTNKPKHILNDKASGMVHQDAAEAADLNSTNISSPSSYQDVGDEFDMMANVTGELKATTEALFCSELVVFYYQQAGWMSKEQLPWKFLPKDFADYRSANVPYYLQPGISLGPMIIISPDGTTSSGDTVQTAQRRDEPAAPPAMGTSPVPQQNPLAPVSKQDSMAPGPAQAHPSDIHLKQDAAPAVARF